MLPNPSSDAPDQAELPTVVLLHGLGRTARSLSRLARRLEAAGYPTWARTYPSRSLPIEALAERVAGWIHDELGDRRLVAVTHSMGGILARFMASLVAFEAAVMLAPPNGGSRVAARLTDNPLFSWWFGPAGAQMGQPTGWPTPPHPFAVIAGDRGRSLSNVPSWVVGGLHGEDPHDGTVAVAETALDGMADFALIHASHTWIMNHPAAAPLITGFLERGAFPAIPGASDPDPEDDSTAWSSAADP